MDLTFFPYRRSILFPQMVMGLPANFALFLGITTAAITLALSQWWFIGVTLLFFILGSRFSQGDPFFFDVLMATLKHVDEAD